MHEADISLSVLYFFGFQLMGTLHLNVHRGYALDSAADIIHS